MDPEKGLPPERLRRHHLSKADLAHPGEDDLRALRLFVAGHELPSDELDVTRLKSVVAAVNSDHDDGFYSLARRNAVLV